jgi:hypothetical protein
MSLKHTKTAVVDFEQKDNHHKHRLGDRTLRTTDHRRGFCLQDDDASGTESTIENSISSSTTTSAATSVPGPTISLLQSSNFPPSSDSKSNNNTSKHLSLLPINNDNKNKWQRLLNRSRQQQRQSLQRPRRQLSLPQEDHSNIPPKMSLPRRTFSLLLHNEQQGLSIPTSTGGENQESRRRWYRHIRNNSNRDDDDKDVNTNESQIGYSDRRLREIDEINEYQDLLDQCNFLWNELHMWQAMHRKVKEEHQATKTELGDVQRQRAWLFEQVGILEKCLLGLNGDDEEQQDLLSLQISRVGIDNVPEHVQSLLGEEMVVHWRARAEVLEHQTIWLQTVLQDTLNGRTLQSSKT